MEGLPKLGARVVGRPSRSQLPVSRITGHFGSRTHLFGQRVNQDLGHHTLVACLPAVANSYCPAQEKYYDSRARSPNRKFRLKCFRQKWA